MRTAALLRMRQGLLPFLQPVLVEKIEALVHALPGSTGSTGRFAADDIHQIDVGALQPHSSERTCPLVTRGADQRASVLNLMVVRRLRDGEYA